MGTHSSPLLVLNTNEVAFFKSFFFSKNQKKVLFTNNQKSISLHFFSSRRNNLKQPATCVNVSPSMSDRPVSRSEMPVGSCTAWSMESSPMVKCHLTKPSEAAMTHLTPSSAKPALASTCPALCSSIWSQL